jgi:hypothetical protein
MAKIKVNPEEGTITGLMGMSPAERTATLLSLASSLLTEAVKSVTQAAAADDTWWGIADRSALCLRETLAAAEEAAGKVKGGE